MTTASTSSYSVPASSSSYALSALRESPYYTPDMEDPYYDPMSRTAMSRTEWGRAQLKKMYDQQMAARNKRLAGISTPMPGWMQQNAQKDIRAGFDPFTAAMNAGVGGLADPITGKVPDGLLQMAALNSYMNKSAGNVSAMSRDPMTGVSGIGYDELMNAYRRAIGL